jgi:hypothetical protein
MGIPELRGCFDCPVTQSPIHSSTHPCVLPCVIHPRIHPTCSNLTILPASICLIKHPSAHPASTHPSPSLPSLHSPGSRLSHSWCQTAGEVLRRSDEYHQVIVSCLHDSKSYCEECAESCRDRRVEAGMGIVLFSGLT